MGTPMAFTSGTTNGFSLGATKRATVAVNPATSLVSGNNWFNGVDVSTQYLIYSDTFSQGQAPITTARPTAWTTPDLTDASLLALINTLPDRVGQVPYTDINVALQWLQNSEKYFLIKNGYEDIVTDGLIANLDAGWYNSYPGSGTVWTDLSGQGNNATLANSPTFTAENGGTLIFDGVDDYAYIPDNASIDLAGDKSYGIWIKLLQDPGGSGFIGKADSSVNGMALAYGWSSNGFQNIAWNSVNAPALSVNASDINNWYYIAGIQNGATRYIYVIGANGIRFSSYAGGNDTWNNSLNLTIGQVAGYYEYISVGAVHIYNRALSSVEVLQNYDAQKSRFGLGGQSLFSGATQYLDFSKQSSYPGSGSLVTDISGNGNDGTFNNGSFTTFNGVKCFNSSSTNDWVVSDPVTLGSNYTIFIWANMLANSEVPDWRTLLRSNVPGEDHELIVRKSDNLLGYYDNENGTGFNSYGINVANAGLEKNWILYSLVGENATSQKVYINNGTSNASVNRNASGQQIYAIGNYQGGNQQWGYFSNYILYNNQAFTQSQVNQYYQSTKQYYGYAYNDIPNYGLVMNLDAGNPISYPGTGTVWYNSSGIGINGELQNGASYSTSGGGSIVFDGVDDRVVVAHNDNLNFGTGDFTVLVWVSGVTSYPGGNKAIIMKGSRFDGNNAGWGIMWAGSPEDLYFIISSDSARLEGRTSPNGGLNGWAGWKLIGMSRIGSTWYQIVNDTFTSLGTFTGNVNNTQSLYLAYNSVYGGYLNSSYGNALIYNRALNQSELSQLYNAQKSRFGL